MSDDSGPEDVCMYELEKITLTLGGLRILSISGVCLLGVIARSERGKRFLLFVPFSLKTQMSHHITALIHCCHNHVGSCNPGVFADKLRLSVQHSASLSEAAPTWSSVVHPCSSGDRRGATGRAGPASPRQKHSAAPTATHSCPRGPPTQAHPDHEQQRTDVSYIQAIQCNFRVLELYFMLI